MASAVVATECEEGEVIGVDDAVGGVGERGACGSRCISTVTVPVISAATIVPMATHASLLRPL